MLKREDGLLSSRQSKLNHLRERGIDPYPPRFPRSTKIATAKANFEKRETAFINNDVVQSTHRRQQRLAGRIISLRDMGRLTFLNLQDESGIVQAMLRRNLLGRDYDLVKDLDLGDFLGVHGQMMRTRTGEITIEASRLTLLSKSVRPLPDKWHGLEDVETRYRQRYLDLIADPEVMHPFAQRSRIISSIRRFLNRRGFLEVDTPILVPVAAGAHARPFDTHHNALNQRLYLRIATELYLKRLIVGGFDKVYELGRVFRNEGIDQDHNPEFTLLESYEAYADYHHVMKMVESMISTVAMEVRGTRQIPYGEEVIDFTPPWPRLQLKDELYRRSGIDLDAYPEDAALVRKAADLGLEVGPRESRGRLIDKLVSTFIEPNLVQPTFLLDYPEVMSPLAKAKPEMPGYVERFEAFAAGMEIANSYTELNDPAVQRARFEEQESIRQLYQDEEVDRLDEDFLTALEYGMPPTGGLGVGIDRLAMLLTGQASIRDVLLFPQMRAISREEPVRHRLPSGGGLIRDFGRWLEREGYGQPSNDSFERWFGQQDDEYQRSMSIVEEFSRWLCHVDNEMRMHPDAVLAEWNEQRNAPHNRTKAFAQWLDRRNRRQQEPMDSIAAFARWSSQQERNHRKKAGQVKNFVGWFEHQDPRKWERGLAEVVDDYIYNVISNRP